MALNQNQFELDTIKGSKISGGPAQVRALSFTRQLLRTLSLPESSLSLIAQHPPDTCHESELV